MNTRVICLDCHLTRNANSCVERFDTVDGEKVRLGFVCKNCIIKIIRRNNALQGNRGSVSK